MKPIFSMHTHTHTKNPAVSLEGLDFLFIYCCRHKMKREGKKGKEREMRYIYTMVQSRCSINAC